MDNVLMFYGEAVRKEITFIRNDEGEVIRATFSSSSRFPSKEGVFNNNRITAFNDVAKRLEKAVTGKEYPLYLSFTAEQSAYKTTEGAVRQSLTLKDFNVITDAGHPGVNNHCIFFGYAVENIYFKEDDTGEIVRANFSASSSANAKVTNENRFVAFGDVAARLKKCKISGPCTMTIDAEQKASKYKDEIQQSYVIKDFRIERFNKSDETEPEEVKEVIEPDYAINGIDELKEFLK